MRPFRSLLVAAAALATLVFANAALAANTGSIAVWHTPMVLNGSQSTTIHVSLPLTNEPIAAINIYLPSGYGVNLGQAPSTSIGTVDAQAYSHTASLRLPLSGTVATDSPSKYTTQSTACARTPASAAVWILNLSVAGQTLMVPLYVNPTAGVEQGLGAYKLSICLPPWDIPESAGGAAQGAQLLDAKFTVNGIFTTPTGGGLLKWDALFTSYNPGKGTANPASTFEARAFVPLPIILGLQASYKKQTRTYTLTGRASEGGLPGSGFTVAIARGASATALKQVASVKTGTNGSFKSTGKLTPKKTTFFQASASAGERDYTALGCQNPATAVAPAGCLNATLSPWSAKSRVARVKS